MTARIGASLPRCRGPRPRVFGFKVKAYFSLACPVSSPQVYRNVTEVHYNYRPGMVAFESNIHRTGITWSTDNVVEFEVTSETEIQEAF